MFHPLVTAALGLVGFVPFQARSEPERARGDVELGLSIVCEGLVFDPDGAPVPGAVVVSSAGGKAVTGAGGRYRLALDVPAGTQVIRVTAAGGRSGSMTATASVDLSSGGESAWVPPLELSEGNACQPSWLPLFTSEPGVSGSVQPSTLGNVNALAVLDSGSGPALYAAGDFMLAGGVAVRNIARWEGSGWADVGGGLDNTVNCLTVFDDGSGPALYAGGSFTVAGTSTVVNRVARWDGSSWSSLDSGMNLRVEALAVYDGGNGPALYAGGEFTVASGVVARKIARWDGHVWNPVAGGMNGIVNALVVFDDGTGPALHAGGSFTAAGGVGASGIARWKGESWFPLGSGVQGSVLALDVFDDGAGPALYVGGAFVTAGGTSARNIARWNGSRWSALGSGTAGFVLALTVHDDGSGAALYAGGDFTSAGGVQAEKIARWDGSVWSGLGIFQAELGEEVRAFATFDDGNGPVLCAGGEFMSAGGLQANSVASWNGASWAAFGGGRNLVGGDGTHDVLALAVFDDGSGPALYAGGDFTAAGGVSVNRIARWSGTSWSALGSGMDGIVHALSVYDDGGGPELYAGGIFAAAGGVSASRIAKWDGSSWSALASGMSGNVGVFALTVFDGGSGPELVAAGSFSSAGGVSAKNIASWNGSSWRALGAGPNGGNGVRALVVHDDGNGPALYAGGNFLTAGGLTVHNIARWSGSSWSGLGGGTNSDVYALAAFDDGSGAALYAGGQFSSAGGVAADSIARWSGSSWTALGNGLDGNVLALEVFDDGSGPALHAGGAFTIGGGAPQPRHVARWDGTAWSPLGSGAEDDVLCLAVFNDRTGSALHAGGSFFGVLDSGDARLAKWGCTDTTAPEIACPAPLVVGDHDGDPGESVSFTVTAVDAEDYQPSVVCVPPSGSHFPRGTTLVHCTATDFSGNQSTCQFAVTVRSQLRELSPR